MKPNLTTHILVVVATSLLLFCCKKKVLEPSALSSLKAEARNQQGATTATNALLTDPNIINYVGDLSVSIANTNRSQLDSCTRLVKVFYNVTVKNTAGNSKFSFDVQFFKNGAVTTFYYPDGSTKNNGRAKIENLNINETRTVTGYIQTSYVAPDAEVSNAFTLKGQITQLLVQDLGQPIYKIQTDIAPKNNVATIQTSLPYFAFSKTEFDDLNLTAMPGLGALYGYPAAYPDPNLPAYTPFTVATDGTNTNYIILQYGTGELSAVQFIKAGCLPMSGKPFYYMKARGKYLTYALGTGLVLADATASNEMVRRWVFTPAPAVQGAFGPTYFIYNMALGKNLSLQVYLSQDKGNYISVGTHDATNKQQVFVIK